MAIFKLKSQLPRSTQDEIDRVLAIPSAQRLASESAFLTALGTDYTSNEVVAYDSYGLILRAVGITVPTGAEGFVKGAFFIKTNASGNGTYMNTGTDSVSAWDLVDQASTTNIDDKAVTYAKLDITVKDVVIALGEATGTATVVAGSKVLSVIPTGNVDQVIKNVSISSTTLTVDLIAVATAQSTVKVLVIG